MDFQRKFIIELEKRMSKWIEESQKPENRIDKTMGLSYVAVAMALRDVVDSIRAASKEA